MKKTVIASSAAACLLLAAVAYAVSTSTFEVSAADAIRKGRLEGVALKEPASVELAREKKEVLKAEGEVVWSLALDAAGSVYAGTSPRGKVYVVRDGKSSVAFDTDESAIFATAVGPDGKLYYAGGPSGNVFRDGKRFVKLGASYVWALMFDAGGGLYAATGPDGKVFRIDAAGTAVEVLDSPDPHILCLARDSKGNIYAGSSKSGLVYLIPPVVAQASAAKPRIVYDAAESEIRAIAVDEKDNVYFGTSDVAPGRPSRTSLGMRGPVMAPPAEAGPSAAGPGASAASPMPAAAIRDEVSATNAIYRLAPDGSVVQIFAVRGKMILSLAWANGALYAGTGNRGDLLRIDPETGEVTTIEPDLEKQIVSLVPGRAGELYMGTGDQGRVWRYAREFAKEGQYTSDVFDAKFPARFGVLTWTGVIPPGTTVEAQTQSGNVADPDASWSEWSAPAAVSGLPVASPTARYIRYRLKLKTAVPAASPVVDDVRIAFLPSNQPPKVKAVKVTLPQDKLKDRVPGQVDVAWQAEDPNGDRMQYTLEFRLRGDTAWRTLVEKADKTSYTWKTDAVPDGSYELRVTASDSPDNPKESALANSRVSEAFVVDNTRPIAAVTVRPGDAKSGKASVDVVMTDVGGTIKCAEYSLDSGDWQPFLPDDRVYDSPKETATIPLEGLKDGEHTVTIRVTDSGENVGAGSRTFAVK